MTGDAYRVLQTLSGEPNYLPFDRICEQTHMSSQRVSAALAELSRHVQPSAYGDDGGWWISSAGRSAFETERAEREKGHYWRLSWATGEMWFESRAESLASATALPEGLSCSVTQMTITRAEYASRRRNAGQSV
jgi:hypothetical protein